MPTFETPESISATIEIAGGRVAIDASHRTDTNVTVVPSDDSDDGDVQAAQQVRVEYVNGHLSVRTPRNRMRTLFGRPPSIDVTIELPTGSRIDAKAMAAFRSTGRIGDSQFNSAVGPVRLDETGRLNVRTAAGDVSVVRSAGPTEVTTASGKISIGTTEGAATLKTSNGDITIGEVTGDVHLKTANGDITIDRALGDVDARTAHGSVRVGEVVRGSVGLETGFGEVELGVREGTAAWLDLASKWGAVRSDLEASDEPDPAADKVEVRARTGVGDIAIFRAEAVR